MHQRLKEVTDDAISSQDALLQAYDPDRLYNFRVAARRIRSILKQIDSHRSRLLRKAWGGLAAVTGDARDWDVFLATSGALLDPAEQREFEAINRERIANAREDVLNMLKSSLWRRHLAEWQEYLVHAEEKAPDPSEAGASLERALNKAAQRFDAAQAEGNDHNWHRYRISVKEVRYVAEASADAPGAKELTAACRAQQTLLGDWHDTVVQMSILEELAKAPVHETLANRIRDRKAAFLSELQNLSPVAQPEW